MLSKEEVKTRLLKYWQVDELKFLAEFHRPKNPDNSLKILPYGFFVNPTTINKDRTFFYPKYDGLEFSRKVSIKQKLQQGLIDGQYYFIELSPEDEGKRIHNPFQLKIEKFNFFEDYKPPQEFIRNWFFRKGENPEDAATIASQLKLNELELYTHTKRFIFELIQNADDMPPGNNQVNIEIHLLKNHLLFLHNGKYFDRDDVKAISDAAKSTKVGSVTQTGYKGIGFKSVFTDSNRVYIKSGDYSFKFDKQAAVYTDFWTLYADYFNSKTPLAKKEFQREYNGREELFTNIDRIPWQIKPIWVSKNEYPDELVNSFFLNNHQVAIALEVGSAIFKQKDYHGMISGLMKEPRFLLFLRNTRSFIFNSFEPDESISIALKYGEFSVDVYKNQQITASYIREDFLISIGNDDFEKAGMNFKKRELEGGKVEFYDTNGQKLENIPEKLGRLQSTVVSFAAKVSNSSIEGLSRDETILFNYLPTSDQRFEFPFLVNADFVSKTDREFIQIENKWNHYVFYHIGVNCIKWIAKLGQTFNEINRIKYFIYAKSYLNLLPETLLDESNEELSSINKAFNRGIVNAIENIAFILDDDYLIKKCQEIIIDETGIVTVLGLNFFKTITKTNKSLPHLFINSNKLKKKYLGIDRFELVELKTILSIKENQIELSITIYKLGEVQYKEFLKWIDKFSLTFSDDSSWFCSIPILKISDSVCSINDALLNDKIHIRTAKTKLIEPILKKLGYEFTACYIDEYTNLFENLSQTDTYLNRDIKLYDRIALNPKLGELNANEKNILLLFLKNLDGVGEIKYADTLPLFKSKFNHGVLRPLSSLISNLCKNIPDGLSQFTIDNLEETKLSNDFKKHLINEANILEKIFCNANLFKELTIDVNETKLESFYSYILNLYKALPEGKLLNYTGIPWIYSPSLKSFQLPASIYCPDSLLNLKQANFASIQSVIEKTSSESLPHYAALSIIESFALGCKKVSITSIITTPATFDMSIINDFMDWANSIGEKHLLRKLSIEKKDSGFVVSISKDQIQYFSKNDDLIKVIENASHLNNKMVLLPSELYSIERHQIGLIENESLLKYLLENSTPFLSFANFIYLSKDDSTKLLFIEKISCIDLVSNKKYEKESCEHKILDMIIELGKENDEYYNSILKKLTIDGHGLFKKNISDDVIFKFPATATTLERRYVLKLSVILPTYNDETAALTTVIENFVDIKNKNLLRKVFKTILKKIEEIFHEIHSLNLEYFSPCQMLFLMLYQEDKPKLDYKKGKLDFDEYWFEKDKNQHELLSAEFLTLLFENRYTQLQNRFVFKDFNFSNSILNENYSINSEKLPEWALKWLNDDNNKAEKIKFLIESGLNSDTSPIVLLRKSIIESNNDDFDRGLATTDNVILLFFTFYWLEEMQEKNNALITKPYIKLLYKKFEDKKAWAKILPIPVLVEFGLDSYQFVHQAEGQVFHNFNDGWGEFGDKIFSSIKNSGGFVVDDVLPVTIQKLILAITAKVIIEPDLVSLNRDSEVYDEPYYKNWLLKANYPIRIYKGTEIPYSVNYLTLLKIAKTDGKSVKNVNVIYITEDERYDIFPQLKNKLSKDVYNELRVVKDEYEREKKREQNEINYTDQEAQALFRLFGDEVPRGFHKDLNLASLIKGLIYLSNNGYDTAEAEVNLKSTHIKSQLYPVYAMGADKISSNAFKIKCRSAKSGLLYLRASSWQELENKNTYLYVLTGKYNTDCRLCTTREEVIKDKKADFRVLRIEADTGASDIDDIIQGKFNPEKIWLILRMAEKSEYKSIFENIRKNEEGNTINDINLGDESYD